MFLMSNSTKICNVFNKYKSKIVQLNFKIKVVSLPGNKDKFPPEPDEVPYSEALSLVR